MDFYGVFLSDGVVTLKELYWLRKKILLYLIFVYGLLVFKILM